MSNEAIFWTQVGSILVFIVTLFSLYRLLAEQKDSTIQLLRETVVTLKDQLAEARRNTPDVLAQTLASRVKLLEGELERLSKDQDANQERIRVAQDALRIARQEAEELAGQVQTAHELLQDFSCPHCGAPLITRAHFNESVAYQGREIDVDHEYIEFECGYAERDDKPEGQCRNNAPSSIAET